MPPDAGMIDFAIRHRDVFTLLFFSLLALLFAALPLYLKRNKTARWRRPSEPKGSKIRLWREPNDSEIRPSESQKEPWDVEPSAGQSEPTDYPERDSAEWKDTVKCSPGPEGMVFRHETHRQYSQHLPSRSRMVLNFLGVLALLGVFGYSLWLGVIAAYGKLFSPTAGWHLPEPICSRDSSTLLLFIHGWLGDDHETWKDFPRLVCDDTSLKDLDVIAVHYPSYMASRNVPITDLAAFIADDLGETRWKKYRSVMIISHSMGGLVSRKLVIRRRLGGNAPIFGALVEIGTPHQGANFSRLADALGLSEGLTEEMAKDSNTLQTLRTDWYTIPREDRPETFCLSSEFDSVVPVDSALALCDSPQPLLPCCDHRELVKPQSPTDLTYLRPMGIIKSALERRR